MDCEALQEWFGEEKSLRMEIFGTDKERLLEMIEALGEKPLHAISKKSPRINLVKLRIQPLQSWIYCK
jgi:hypothetical protein